MKYYHLKPISTLITKSPSMHHIIIKLQQLEEIKKIIPNFLPKVIADNCIVANLKNSILTLVTNSPAWKHQLNFLKMDLLEQLRKSSPLLAGLSSIAIKIDYLQEDLYKYHNNMSEYYKCFFTPKVNNHHLNHFNNDHCSTITTTITNNNENNFNPFNKITINKFTSTIIENIINQEINYPPLLDAFKNLLTTITR